MWLLPITCLIGGAVFLFVTDLRFNVYQNINIAKYIKTNFNVSDSLEDLQLFNTQQKRRPAPIRFNNQVGGNNPENGVETISIPSKYSL